jgi:3-oxoacyl-[acyl-carrier protein] reductase
VTVSLVTGANGLLGQAIAQALIDASPDAQVWLGVRERRERAEALAQSYPDRCRCISLEVTDPGAWRTAVAEIEATAGRLDILVNNAGHAEDGLLATMPADAWSRVISVNLDAVFHGCQSVLPGMISRRYGRIINLSSLSALLAPAGQANYAAAKAGVVGLTKVLSRELAKRAITVNAVAPGVVLTDMGRTIPAESLEAMLGEIPLHRFGEPREIAEAILFLVSPMASYVTGQTLHVNGGWWG